MGTSVQMILLLEASHVSRLCHFVWGLDRLDTGQFSRRQGLLAEISRPLASSDSHGRDLRVISNWRIWFGYRIRQWLIIETTQ
jgi:hypothetical protein